MKHYKFLFLLLLNIPIIILSQKTALVCGAGGFIGSHLAKRLKSEGFWVRGVDLKYPEFDHTLCDDFVIGDLRNPDTCKKIVMLDDSNSFDEVYQLAADMGGMGFIAFHDAEIMHNSGLINLNMVEACRISKAKKIFYSSSACIYPEYNQLDPNNPNCAEGSAYPAAPDTEYGWEKLFSERLYRSYAKDYKMNIRIARLHNVFGPQGTWTGGREKAPAALSRKIAQAKENGSIEIWGKGDQTRSFLYIDECIEGIRRLMNSDVEDVINIGSDEMISINNLALLISKIANKNIKIVNIKGPEGVRGRCSNNDLIKAKLNWSPTTRLEEGLRLTYPWIEEQVKNSDVTISGNIQTQEVITNPERSDGFGAQFQTLIYSVIYAELTNKKFVYTPFNKMEHNYDNDPEFLNKKEDLINFKNHFEINKENAHVLQLRNLINFFESNLQICINSNALKKIKTIFRENKHKDNYFKPNSFNIAVHVRRPNKHDSRIQGADTHDEIFLNIINKLRTKYLDKNLIVHIYSQGNIKGFQKYINSDVILHINESVEDTFTSMVLADVLVTSASSLSYVAGILSEGDVYYMPFWHAPLPNWVSIDML